MAPVTNSPAGTITRPPFAAWQAAMAFSKACVQSVLLSPMAPNFVTSKSRAGKTGGLMRARIPGNNDQGPSLPASKAGKRDVAVKAASSLGAANAPLQAASPAAASRPFISSRLFIVLFSSNTPRWPELIYSAVGFQPSEPARKATALYFLASVSLNCFEYGSRFDGLAPAPADANSA